MEIAVVWVIMFLVSTAVAFVIVTVASIARERLNMSTPAGVLEGAPPYRQVGTY